MTTLTWRGNGHRPFHGFTLIELLVVTAIIAMLAGLLLPAIGKVQTKAEVMKATTDIANIKGAISAYQAEYSALPVPRQLRDLLAQNPTAGPDFTFGTIEGGTWPATKIQTPGLGNASQANNAEVVAILQNIGKFRNGKNALTPAFARNPKDIKFLHAPLVDGTLPGVGPDGVFRDPWGKPYIVTMDVNGDEQSRDGFYRLDTVSTDPKAAATQGLYGQTKSVPNKDNFEHPGEFMVWSLGPDGQADPSVPGNQGVNKDNVLGW